MGAIGWKEILIIAIVIIILFGGASRLPDIAKSIAKSIREFKKSLKEVEEDITIEDDDDDENKKSQSSTPTA